MAGASLSCVVVPPQGLIHYMSMPPLGCKGWLHCFGVGNGTPADPADAFHCGAVGMYVQPFVLNPFQLPFSPFLQPFLPPPVPPFIRSFGVSRSGPQAAIRWKRVGHAAAR